METEPNTPDRDETLLGDADEVDHPSIEEQVDEQMERENADDDAAA
jgi:hypothetical protein